MGIRVNAPFAAAAMGLAALGGCASGTGSALSAKDPAFASVDRSAAPARLASGASGAAPGTGRGAPIYASGNIVLPRGPTRGGGVSAVAGPRGARATGTAALPNAGGALGAAMPRASLTVRAGGLADAEVALGGRGAQVAAAVGDPLSGVGGKGALRLTGSRPAGAGGLSGAAADATGSLIGAGKGATSTGSNDNAADRLLRKALRKAKRTGLIGG